MSEMDRIFRRGPLAVAIMLSACAAANPSGAADTAGAAYGPFLSARYADAQNDPAIATHYYSVALRADPANQALIDEGFIAAVLAGSSQAPALARQITGNAVAVMLLGNQAALQGDYAAAAEQYSQLPQDELSTLLKPLLLAWAQAGAGNSSAAQADLVPLANGSPYGGVYLISAALIADTSNNMKDATQLYAAADSADNAPNLRMAQILASWKARQGNTDAARAELLQMAASHPSLAIALPALEVNIAAPVIKTPTDGLAESYLTIAGSLNQPAQTLLRITFLRFALDLRPDLAAARLLLASVQAGDGLPAGAAISDNQIRQALATLRAIPPSDPLFSPAILQAANLMAALGDTKGAVALLDEAAATNPQNIDALQEAGDILRGNGQFGAAIPYYDRAIAVLPAPPPPDAWTLYYDRGIAQDQNGNWSAAEPDMQKALTLSPNQPYVLNYLGYTWALQGRNLVQAQSMLQQAAGLAPNEGAIVDSLGFVNLRQGQTAQALKLLTQAVEMDPDDAEVNAHLGDAFYAAGLHLQADYQWQRALALKPDPKLQAEIEGKLKTVSAARLMVLSSFAPAKVNLFLHVTGRRADGYHLLDSLAVFPNVGDRLTAVAAEALSLRITGSFGADLSAAPDNLVLRAARLLRSGAGAALTLAKNLPVASGIGGGSADAAAALRLLARLWDFATPLEDVAAALGADVPVCLARRAARMGGVGEILGPAPRLPHFGIVLVNPGVAVATAEVFRARQAPFSAAADLPGEWASAAAMAEDLSKLSNDLEAPARALAPVIGTVLEMLRALPGVLLARMSGSGATCFAIFETAAAAKAAAALVERPGWWVWGGGLYEPVPTDL